MPLIDEVTESVTSVKELLDEAEVVLLPVSTTVGDRYLVNRMERMIPELRSVIKQFRSRDPEDHSEATLRKFYGQLNSKDLGLPLLEPTMIALRKLHQAELDKLGDAPEIEEEDTLAATLDPLFEACVRAKKPVRFLFLRTMIRQAGVAERATIGADSDLLAKAAACMSPPEHWIPYPTPVPDDFPDFVAAIGVRLAGSVTPLGEAEVDAAIRKTLGDRLNRALGRGVTVIGHVATLDKALMDKVMRKYTPKIAGMSSINAFTADNMIYLNVNKGDATTIVHEGIHLYSDDQFKDTLGGDLDEGVTEYFALKVVKAMGKVRPESYPKQVGMAATLIEALSEDGVASFYFDGSDERAEGHFINLRKKNAGCDVPTAKAEWITFKGLCLDKKWDNAVKLLG